MKSIHERVKFLDAVDPVQVFLFRGAVDDNRLWVTLENLVLHSALLGFRCCHDFRPAVSGGDGFVGDVNGRMVF